MKLFLKNSDNPFGGMSVAEDFRTFGHFRIRGAG
jgi:hypothetical protein